MVFITDTYCVYCAVRAGSLNMIEINACVHKTAPKFSNLLLLAISVLPGMGFKDVLYQMLSASYITLCRWASLS